MAPRKNPLSWMVTLTALLILAGCSLPGSPQENTPVVENQGHAGPSQLFSTGPAHDTTGEGGVASVRVSEGVILFTPGAPVPLSWLSDEFAKEIGMYFLEMGSDIADAVNEPEGTPVPALDPANLPLPDGVVLYTQMTGLDITGIDPTGKKMSYFLFNSVDSQDAVFSFYQTQLESSGYNTIETKTPDESGAYDGSWMKRGLIVTVTVTPGTGGGVQVMVAWMSL